MQIAVLGSGMWACALATLLAKMGHRVNLWGRNPERVQQLRCNRQHPHIKATFPASIAFTTELKDALHEVELVIESVTLGGLRDALGALRRHQLDVPLILTSKGIELQTHQLPSQIATEIFQKKLSAPILALSGPTLAREVMEERPTCAVIACKDLEIAIEISKTLSTSYFHVYPHSDVLGVQFGGAYKNIIAIACGLLDGMGQEKNTKAALLTRGLHEMRRIALAIGCLPQTLIGLSGLGDLVATSLSFESRNYQLGKLLIEGYSPQAARERIGSSVEGIDTCRAILSLSQSKGVNLPLAKAVFGCLNGDSPKALIEELMRFSPHPEWT